MHQDEAEQTASPEHGGSPGSKKEKQLQPFPFMPQSMGLQGRGLSTGGRGGGEGGQLFPSSPAASEPGQGHAAWDVPAKWVPLGVWVSLL